MHVQGMSHRSTNTCPPRGSERREQLKRLPALKRAYKQKRESLYQDELNKALRNKAEKMEYSTPLKLGACTKAFLCAGAFKQLSAGCVSLQ